MKVRLLIIPVVLLSLLLRIVGLNWDSDWHLHPDERFLTMVAMALKWPTSFSQYLDTASSPLNPHNAGHGLYVYGTYPVILVKAVAEWLGRGDYTQLTLVGRALSAAVDTGTLLLVFLIARRLTSRDSPALLAASFYGLMVLPIQLSHFFAVDSYLVLFLTSSFYILIYLIDQPAVILFIFLGLSFGLAIAAKITAILFAPIIAIGVLISLIKHKSFLRHFLLLLLFTLALYFTVRLSQPYLFADSSLVSLRFNPAAIDNWRQLRAWDQPDAWFPPATQWINSQAFLYPLENLILWGLGLPLAIISLSSLVHILTRYRRHLLTLALVWIIGLFVYQGAQFAKPMRYFYPLYPFLAITSGVFFFDLSKRYRLLPIAFLLILIWPLSFVSIYTRPHSRVTASEWIFKNLPPGSTLSCEYWDDCLPLSYNHPYQIITLPLYDRDTPQKWLDLSSKLAAIDYLVLTSNRLYGSILTIPERYPITSRFYQLLFSGKLGFQKIAEFSSRPHLPLPIPPLCLTPPAISYGAVAFPLQECTLAGLSFVDDYADETFTVYDHPKVLIFKKVSDPNLDLLR